MLLFMCKKFVLLKTKATYRMYLSQDITYPPVNISVRHLFQTCTEKVVRLSLQVFTQDLKSAKRVALTSDGWTSCKHTYRYVIGPFIDNDWQLKNFVLQTPVMEETHLGHYIAEVLIGSCEESGRTDTGPQNGRQTQANSLFEILKRYSEQQAAVMATLLDKKVRKGPNCVHTLNASTVSTAQEMVNLLSQLKAATTLMCKEKRPTVSVIAALGMKLLDHFQVTMSDSPIIQQMKCLMAEDIRERYVKEEHFLLKATASDPRFKKLPFLTEMKSSTILLKKQHSC